jgi:hypothetical protein
MVGHPSARHSKERFAMNSNDTVIIPISRNKVTIVDASDAELVLSMGRWTANPTSNGFYARYMSTPPLASFYLHQMLMNFPARMIDHIDGDTLNNQRSNLRIVTPSQSVMNTTIRADNKSGHRGIFWDKNRGKWRADIKAGVHKKSLGRFDCIEDAIAAYNKAAAELFGEYRRT